MRRIVKSRFNGVWNNAGMDIHILFCFWQSVFRRWLVKSGLWADLNITLGRHGQ